MAWNETPARSTVDTNSSGDINNKQDNETALKGGTPASAPNQTLEEVRVGTSLNEFKIGDGADTDKDLIAENADANKPILRYNKTTNTWQFSNDGVTINNIGGGNGEPNPSWGAGGFDYPTSDPAALDIINSGSIANVKLLGQGFDDTTNESVEQEFKVPSDIDPSGTVTFILMGIAETAASANTEFRLSHSVSNDNEDADVAYTHEDSGAKAVNTNQDRNTYFTWTETVSNLGWTANDMCKIQLTRLASGGNDNLPDDFYPRYFEIDIPRI